AWGGWMNGAVYLGEIATGGVRRHFTGHRGRIGCLAFSADGKTLVSGSEDTTALVWDLTGRLSADARRGKALSEQELKTHWSALARAEAAAGYGAVQALAADPERSVPFLRRHLRPIAAVEEKRLTQLIADLDSAQFKVREKAAV